jgi:hypothetical protein
MFTYRITLTNGAVVTINSDKDPTDHPTFRNRVVNVETVEMVKLQLV